LSKLVRMRCYHDRWIIKRLKIILKPISMTWQVCIRWSDFQLYLSSWGNAGLRMYSFRENEKFLAEHILWAGIRRGIRPYRTAR